MPSESSAPSVLFVTRKWPPAVGGMETYASELTSALAAEVEIAVRALAGRPDGRPPAPWALCWFYVSTAWLLWRERRQFEVVHFGDLVLFPLVWWDALVAPRRRRVVTVHGLDVIYGTQPGLLPRVYRVFLWWARRRSRVAQRYIANSAHTARLAAAAGFRPVVAVPLGVRLGRFEEPAEPPAAPERFVFFFGRAVPRKGLRWFAEEVLPLLPDDVELLAAGTIWDVAALPRNSARFRHLGIVSDQELTYWCRRSVAVVVPNLPSTDAGDVEGFGLVNLEAAARGGVVLGSQIEGIVDAIDDGSSGFLLLPGDPSAWAVALREILAWDTDERRSFTEAARRRLREHFSWARVAADTADVYRQVLFEAAPAGPPIRGCVR